MNLRNILTWLGLIGTAIGIILSIYFYSAQKRVRALAFVVDPKKTLLVSPQRLPNGRLTILDSEGKKISRDIYALEAYLWNSGTETILANEVIVPLTVAIPNSVKVLDVQTRYVSRPEITQGTAALESSDGAAKLHFNFRVLESNEGIAVTMLYEGTSDVELHLSGGITGIKSFTEPKPKVRALPPALFVSLIATLATMLAVLLIFQFIKRRVDETARFKRLASTLLSVALWLVAADSFQTVYFFVRIMRSPAESPVREVPSELLRH